MILEDIQVLKMEKEISFWGKFVSSCWYCAISLKKSMKKGPVLTNDAG